MGYFIYPSAWSFFRLTSSLGCTRCQRQRNISPHTFVAPLPTRTTIFESSSSCSADHAQPLSDSELPPLRSSLEIRQYGLSPLGHLHSMVCLAVAAFPGTVTVTCQSEEQARYNSWEICYLCGHLLWAAAATREWGVASWAIGHPCWRWPTSSSWWALVAATVVLGRICPRTIDPYLWKTTLPLCPPCQSWYLGVYGQT